MTGRASPTSVAFALLAGAVVVHVAAVIVLGSINGFWWDEYFSLWASDPTVPFGTAFAARIWPDSNPPLYFSLVHLVRSLGAGDQAAFFLVNGAAAALAGGIVLRDGIRRRAALQAAVAVAGALVSGPAVAFAAEGRSYPVALAEVLVAAWFAIRSVTGRGEPASLAGMALLGLLAAATHVFAALACCSLAAGAIVAGGLRGRRTAVPMIVLGGSAAGATVAWVALNWGAGNLVDWIRFDLDSFLVSVTEAARLVLGAPWMAAAVVGVMAAMAGTAGLGRVAAAFAVAIVCFVGIPTAVSFVKPILTQRYLLVIAPAIPVALAAVLAPGVDGGRLRTAALAVLTAVSLAGLPAAWRFTQEKSVWRGADVVAAAGRTCGPGSIAVNGPAKATQDGAWRYGLSRATGLPEDTFAIAGRGTPARLDCPVLGWAEHLYGPRRSAAEMLAMIGIDRPEPEVDFVVHANGFVVLDRQR